jgi:4-hydroxybenzoyl-CoA reductase subunit beta
VTALLPDFHLTQPRALAEVIAARRDHPGSPLLAGGTDLLVNMRHGLHTPSLLIDLSGVDELNGIDVGEHDIRIGAGVRIAEIESHTLLAERYPALQQAASAIAGPGHRRMGTVGGNLCLDTRCTYYNQSEWWRRSNGYCLKERGETCHVAPQGQRCHAAYSGDLAPALLALKAEMEIAGPGGRRRLPLSELYVEDGRAHLALASDEIVVAVFLPATAASKSAYGKVRVRDAIDYPLAGVAVALTLDDGRLTALRVALTGTNSRPFALDGTDDLVGKPVSEDTLLQIERLVHKQTQPMRTTMVSAQYRRLAAAGLARKLFKQLVTEPDGVP